MEITVKFINQNEYDFVDDKGIRRAGITVNVFDTVSKKIIKVKSQHLLDNDFGDDIKVLCVPNGRFLNYSVA